MATLDESPSLYLGQPWTVWADKVEGKHKDSSSPSEAESIKRNDGSDSMKLRKADMALYGFCPARDELYLVVCESCGQVIKPQALALHIKQRHPGGGKRKRRSSRSHSISSTSPVAKVSHHSSTKHDAHDKSPPISPIKGGTRSWSSHSRQKNHSMPVVTVERLPSPIAAVKRAIPPGKSMTASKTSPKSLTTVKSPPHLDGLIGSPVMSDSKFSDSFIAPESPKIMTASKTPEKEPVLSPRSAAPFLFSKPIVESKTASKSSSSKSSSLPQSKSTSSSQSKSGSSNSQSKSSSSSQLKSSSSNSKSSHSKSSSSSQSKSGSKSTSSQSKLSSTKSSGNYQFNRNRSRSTSPVNDISEENHHSPPPSHASASKGAGSSDIEKDPLSSSGSSASSSMSSKMLASLATSVATTVAMLTTSSTVKTASSPSTTTTSKSNKFPHYKPQKLIPCKDREFDANYHCGVWVADTQRQCTRSLTCKTHALSLRRAVTGRRKPFDDLLKEHRAAKEAMLKAKADAKAAGEAAKAGGTPSSAVPPSANSHSSSHKDREKEKGSGGREHGSSSSSSHKSLASSSSSTKLAKPQLPMPNRPAAPMPPAPKEEPIPETCSRLSSDGEDDGDDEREKLGYPTLAYHPRPAAVNNFGGRLAGSGCYVFNRKTDLLRAAFVVAVERHLHPPPHKKLCVESKLPQGSQIMTNSKDPYEFTVGEGSPWGSGKGSNRLKPPKSSLAVSRTIKPKDQPGSRSPVGSGSMLSSSFPSATLGSVAQQGKSPLGHSQTPGGSINSSGGGMKRKRSGSSPGPGGGAGLASPIGGTLSMNSNPTNSPISIAIPTGSLTLNLSSTTLSNFNTVTVAPNKVANLTSHKNNLLKDVNIVVTNMEPNSINGQVLTTGLTGTNLADVTQLQLNSLVEKTASAKNRSGKSTNSKSSGLKHVMVSGPGEGANFMSPMLTTLPGGHTVMMDSQGGTMLTPVSIATSLSLGSTTVSPPQSSPSTTPSPLFTSGSTSPQVSATSPLPNGILPSPSGGAGLKSVPANHMGSAMAVSPASRNSTPSPASVEPTQASNAHMAKISSSSSASRSKPSSSSRSKGSRSSSGHHRSSSGVRGHHQVNPLMSLATSQQFAAGTAIALTTQPSRLLTSSSLSAVYAANQVLGTAAPSGQFSHIQIQPKQGGGKTVATGKLAMQPVSLTIPIVAPSGMTMAQTQQQQARALLLQGDDRQKHLSQQMQNSPSNVIS